MWVFRLYRFYSSILSGIGAYFFLLKSAWLSAGIMVIVRLGWFFFDHFFKKHIINRDFKKHIYEFKKQNGPYGIRIANKAEKDWRIKESLSEVFTPNIKKLEKTIETLETMDTLFKSGLSPQGDEYLLHDLRLKYGRYRLANNTSS